LLTLHPERLTGISLPVSTSWLLGSCMEARGKQDLWTRQKPEIVAVLREQAIIQSVESSNRIEGVTVTPERLRPVVLGKVRPRDRSEEELLGYRRALQWIFSRRQPVAVTPAVIQRLHTFTQGTSVGDAGQWKEKDNEIIEILPDGDRRVRFVPTTARETPGAIDELCDNLAATGLDGVLPPLLGIGTFIFDFLCIHPFRDGNGRVSRLLTTLMLESEGYIVPRFISLERLIEESREDYYRILFECSEGWHDGKNEIIPWWNHFLGILHRAYREFEAQLESAQARPAKSELVRRTVLDQVGQFTLSDLKAQLPSVSPQLIKKILAEMKHAGQVRLSGRGRGARWEVLWKPGT